jgi:hypothetical protein
MKNIYIYKIVYTLKGGMMAHIDDPSILEAGKKQIGGTSSSTSTKSAGQEIIELLTDMISIYDKDGLSALENYLKENCLTLHDDDRNRSTIGDNLENIRKIITEFNSRYADNLETGYEEFNKQSIEGAICIDAKVDLLASFLYDENPFKTKNKNQVIGLELNEVIKKMCKDIYDIHEYRRTKRKDNVIFLVKKSLLKFIPDYVTEDEIKEFIDLHLEDHLYENSDILDCDGIYKNLLEIESKKTYNKIIINEVDLNTLKIGDILHAKWGSEYPIRSVDQGSVNTSLSGDIQKNQLKYQFTHVSVLQEYDFDFYEWFSTDNGKEVVKYFFYEVFSNNSKLDEFDIPKEKLSVRNVNYKSVEQSIIKYLTQTENIYLEELKNTGSWNSYKDSLPTNNILQIIVNDFIKK